MRDQVSSRAARDGTVHLSDDLAVFAAAITTDRIELSTLTAFLGRRSIGALLLILALPMALPIPLPGFSVVFGIPLIVISAELFLGRHRAWLPARLAQRSFAHADFLVFVERALPALRRLERIIKPRIEWMAGDWAMIPVGAVSLVLSVIITLPIPLGHVVPGTAISLLALGMIERDGLAITLGLIIAILGLALVTLASASIAMTLRAWFAI
jgi:hypothetical protein